MLGVRSDTAKSWSSGRRTPPDQVINELITLADLIDDRADGTLNEIDNFPEIPEFIEIGIASDSHEAQDLGFPCVAAHRALIALVVSRGMAAGHKFIVVPRGSTVATAAAIETHL